MYMIYKIKLSRDDYNIYKVEPDIVYQKMGAKIFTAKANDFMIKRFLHKCKAADSTENPRSKRFLTYDEILSNLSEDGFDLYIFAHKYPKSQKDFNTIIGLN